MLVPFATYGAASAIIAYSGGSLSRLAGKYTGATDAYLHIYDAVALPADAEAAAASLVESRLVQAEFIYDFVWDKPLVLENGLVVCFSTTSPHKTIAVPTGDFIGAFETGSELVGATLTSDTGVVELEVPVTSNLVCVRVVNTNGTADLFVVVGEGTSLEAGEQPLVTQRLNPAAGGVTELNFGEVGRYLADGLVGISLLGTSYSAAAAEHDIQIWTK